MKAHTQLEPSVFCSKFEHFDVEVYGDRLFWRWPLVGIRVTAVFGCCILHQEEGHARQQKVHK